MLQARRRTDVLKQPYVVRKRHAGRAGSDVAKLPADKHDAFAQALTANTQSMRRFWRTLGDGEHGFSKEEASAIQRTLSVGAFVKNHVPLVEILLKGFDTGTYKALPDLARLDEADWVTLVEAGGPPPSIDAAGAATPAEVFARVVYARVTRAYPTAALSSRVTRGVVVAEAERAPLARFFVNNPALELFKHNLAVYLERRGTKKAFEGIDAKDRPGGGRASAGASSESCRVTPTVDAAQEAARSCGSTRPRRSRAWAASSSSSMATAGGHEQARSQSRVPGGSEQRYAGRAVARTRRFNRDAIGVWPNAIGQARRPRRCRSAKRSSATSRSERCSGPADYCDIDSLHLDPQSGRPMSATCCYGCAITSQGAPDGARQSSRRPQAGHPSAAAQLSEHGDSAPLYRPGERAAGRRDRATPPIPTSTINLALEADVREQDRDRVARQHLSTSTRPPTSRCSAAAYPHTLPYSAGLDELRTYLDQSKRGAVASCARRCCQSTRPPRRSTPPSQASASAWHRARKTQCATANFAHRARGVEHGRARERRSASVPAFTAAASISYETLLRAPARSGFVQGALGIRIQGVDDTCDTSVQALAPSPLDGGFLDRRAPLPAACGAAVGYAHVGARPPAARRRRVGNGTLDRRRAGRASSLSASSQDATAPLASTSSSRSTRTSTRARTAIRTARRRPRCTRGSS